MLSTRRSIMKNNQRKIPAPGRINPIIPPSMGVIPINENKKKMITPSIIPPSITRVNNSDALTYIPARTRFSCKLTRYRSGIILSTVLDRGDNAEGIMAILSPK